MSMGRFYQLSLIITTALIILFSSGCSGSARYGHSYSRAGSANLAEIKPQPIPVVNNWSLGRQPGYTLIEFVPVQRSASDGKVGFYSKDQAMMDRDNPPELDYGGGGAAGGG